MLGDARALRRQLADVDWLLSSLGLPLGDRVPGGRYTRCVWHEDGGRPNLVVSLHRDGTIGCKCFGCQATGDALTLIGQARGLHEFPAIFAAAQELLGGAVHPPRPQRIPAERGYPPQDQVRLLWESALRLQHSPRAIAALRARALDPRRLQQLDLVRATGPGCCYPDWAHQRGTTWGASGYQVLLPLWGWRGEMASIHARRFGVEGDERKGVCPTRYTQKGLCFANAGGRHLLASGAALGGQLLICEGAPDFLALSTLYRRPILGVISGSWTDEVAARVPDGCEVLVWCHSDSAGVRYALKITESLRGRCQARAVRPDAFDRKVCEALGARAKKDPEKKDPDINDVLRAGGAAAVAAQLAQAVTLE